MQHVQRGHALSTEQAKECSIIYDTYLRTLRPDESVPTLLMMADLTLEAIEAHAERVVEMLREQRSSTEEKPA